MSDSPPSRRRFLSAVVASTVATALSGCLGAFDGGDADDSTRVLALTLSRDGRSLREQFVDDLSETRLTHDERAFEAARDGRPYTTRYRTPFDSTPEDPTYTERNGTYYRLDSVVVDEATATRPVLRLSDVGDPNDSATPDGVAASRLPAVDRKAVEVAYFAARARGNEGGVPWGLVRRGGYVYGSGEAVDASRLLADDGPTHVTYRETVYAVEIDREQFHGPVYRATVEPVAESPERMEAILRAKFVDARISRDALSPAARNVMESARTGGYSESHPYSSGYRDVLRAMHERAYLDGDVRKDAGVDDEGRRMLRYDGAYYDYRLRFRTE
ncbi:hypothetical protein ACFQJD_03105 [Haloplanus sp. GCM10025708]|uniref:hypothetical protein n=1 Tax=Haloferacaceae TaxID=1644056 RepID=UPI0036207A6D